MCMCMRVRVRRGPCLDVARLLVHCKGRLLLLLRCVYHGSMNRSAAAAVGPSPASPPACRIPRLTSRKHRKDAQGR